VTSERPQTNSAALGITEQRETPNYIMSVTLPGPSFGKLNCYLRFIYPLQLSLAFHLFSFTGICLPPSHALLSEFYFPFSLSSIIHFHITIFPLRETRVSRKSCHINHKDIFKNIIFVSFRKIVSNDDTQGTDLYHQNPWVTSNRRGLLRPSNSSHVTCMRIEICSIKPRNEDLERAIRKLFD
jgi:hypothetical protein